MAIEFTGEIKRGNKSWLLAYFQHYSFICLIWFVIERYVVHGWIEGGGDGGWELGSWGDTE